MSVLAVLNENPAGSHPDVYEAFDLLVEAGLIASYGIYPYPLESQRRARARHRHDRQPGHESNSIQEMARRPGQRVFEQNLTMELVARHIVVETMASRSTESGRHPAWGEDERRETEPLWQRIPPLITGGRMRG